MSVLILQAGLSHNTMTEVTLKCAERGEDGETSLITSVFPLCHSSLEVTGTLRQAVQRAACNMKRIVGTAFLF